MTRATGSVCWLAPAVSPGQFCHSGPTTEIKGLRANVALFFSGCHNSSTFDLAVLATIQPVVKGPRKLIG